MAKDGGVFKRADTEFDADIISEILARLPVKSLMRFRCVRKSWNSLISDPYFAKKHFSYAERGITEISSRIIYTMDPPQSLDHEALKDLKDHDDGHFANRELDFPVMFPHYSHLYKSVVGSCDGLLCILVQRLDFILWNPCTRYSKVLPRTQFLFANKRQPFCGFGYGSTTDDYKVMVGSSRTFTETIIYVFELKTNSWKVLHISNVPHLTQLTGRGYFLNGALHWLVRVSKAGYGRLRSGVLSFDLVEEKFHEMIPLPDDDVSFDGISILRNCLCVYECHAGVSSIWLMQEYGVKQSWTQVIKFSPTGLPEEFKHLSLYPICILENGGVLFNVLTGLFVLYDPKEKTFESVFKTHNLNCGAFIYRETLVSPVTGSV